MTSTLTAHPRLPAALIDQHKAPELRINTDVGLHGCARTLIADKEAVGVLKEIARFLGVRSAEYRAIDWAGPAGTRNDKLDLQFRDMKTRVRVGRYVGIFLNAIHDDGHGMDQREIFHRWNLQSFIERTSRRAAPVPAPKPAPAPLLKAAAPAILSTPVASLSRPSVSTDDAGTFSQNHAKIRRLLELCHDRRDENETISRDQIFAAMREVGGVEDSTIRMGQIVYILTQRGLLVTLNEEPKLYGLDDKALQLIGRMPTPGTARPAAPPAPEPAPVAKTASSAPPSELAGLLRGAEEKLVEVRQLEGDLDNLIEAINENEARQSELAEQHRKLNEQADELRAKVRKLSDVKGAVENLRRVLGIA